MVTHIDEDAVMLATRIPEDRRVEGLCYGDHVSGEGWSGYYVRPDDYGRWGVARMSPCGDDLVDPEDGETIDEAITAAIAAEIDAACESTQVPDGQYYIYPEGSCWEYVEYSGGRCTGSTYQADMGSHIAAGDRYADCDPDSASEDVDLDVQWAILGPRVYLDSIFVMRVPDADE